MPDPDPLGRFRLKRCLNCSYDLRGSWESARCPECGDECDGQLLVQKLGKPLIEYLCLTMAFLLIATLAPVTAVAGSASLTAVCLVSIAYLVCMTIPFLRSRRGIRKDCLGAIISRENFLIVQGRARHPFDWSDVRSWEIMPDPPDPNGASDLRLSWTFKVRHEMPISQHVNPLVLGMLLAGEEAILKVDFDATGHEAAALKTELERRFAASRAVAEAPDHQ